MSEITLIRKLSYVEENRDGLRLGKPRFNPPKYTLPTELEKRIIAHFEELKNYFLSRNYVIRDDFEDIFDPIQLHKSKFSPIFLIENDVWNADAIYGLYLIENFEGSIEIYYYRRNQKRIRLDYDGSPIDNYIMIDARNQIVREFNFQWAQLMKEIKIADDYYNSSKVKLTGSDLTILLESSKYLKEVNPIAACLMLGRGVEMLCKIIMKSEKGFKLAKMLTKMKRNNIISSDEYAICEKIRVIYNKTKHILNFELDPDEIGRLWNDFVFIANRILNGMKLN